MNKIDLQQLIEIYNLDKKEIAETLFPGAKYPTLALNRIISGEALLDSDQVSKLALFIGVPIEKLYSGTKWAGKHNGNTNQSLILKLGRLRFSTMIRFSMKKYCILAQHH